MEFDFGSLSSQLDSRVVQDRSRVPRRGLCETKGVNGACFLIVGCGVDLGRVASGNMSYMIYRCW